MIDVYYCTFGMLGPRYRIADQIGWYVYFINSKEFHGPNLFIGNFSREKFIADAAHLHILEIR